MKKVFIYLLSFLAFFNLNAQSGTMEGVVLDKEKNKPLENVHIYNVALNIGTYSDVNGNFTLSTERPITSLSFSYLGYTTLKLDQKDFVENLVVLMSPSRNYTDEIVVSASRYNEKILEAPVTIQKITSKEIKMSASGDFYQSLGTNSQVDIINNSFNFKVFNTRGFNSTVGYRTVQYIDGVDNLSSGVNFSPGNFLGIADIDIDNVELISGPASALYGPNAIQGVMNTSSRDVFEDPGLAFELKTGTRSFFESQIRYADVLGKNKRFGYKFVVSHQVADDWVGNDNVVNVYGEGTTASQNINNLLESSSFNNENQVLLDDFSTFTSGNSDYLPGQVSFNKEGYKEVDLFSGKSINTKVNTAIFYKFKNNIEIKYSFRYAKASGVFQGNNRVYFNNQKYQNHHVELKGNNFFIRGYATVEDLGDSYSFNILGANLYNAQQASINEDYLFSYVNLLKSETGGFTEDISESRVQELKQKAKLYAETQWLKPGDSELENIADAIKSNPEKPSGALFVNQSRIYHVEGQYNFDIKEFIFFNLGGSYRLNSPNTNGTVLSDTANSEGAFQKITYNEMGAYLQASKNIFKDKLQLKSSIRVDKSTDFKPQISPRFSVVSAIKNNYFRFAVQSAFRNPTQNERFFFLNVGPAIVLGNTTGHDNMYTLSSVLAYNGSQNIDDLDAQDIAPLQPEKITSFEFGYKNVSLKNTMIDFSIYYNKYKKFIGRVNMVAPENGSVYDNSAVQSINDRDYTVNSVIVNSVSTVKSYGGSIGLVHYLKKGLKLYSNYTYASFIQDENDGLIPGFNTPKHKFNIGFQSDKIWKGLGLSANWTWSDYYDWESPFASGRVPAFHYMDVKAFYNVEDWHSTFSIGASNVYNNEHIEAFGGGVIGAFYYCSYKFDFSGSLNGSKKVN